jgi:hypothetical protein
MNKSFISWSQVPSDERAALDSTVCYKLRVCQIVIITIPHDLEGFAARKV